MNNILRIVLIVCSIATLAAIVFNTRKNHLFYRYSVLWIIMSLIIVILALFPGIVYFISSSLGFEKPVNAIFLIAIFVLLCLSFYLYIKVSDLNKELTNLNYKISIIEKEMEGSNNKK